MIIRMPTIMAYQEHDYGPPEHMERHRIPERASPRSPPPPRAMDPPQPRHTKHKVVTIETLKKSQVRTGVVLAILVVLPSIQYQLALLHSFLILFLL